MGLMASLPDGPIAIDTAIIIYFIERHAVYTDLLRPLFRAADAGERLLVTSGITLLEVLVRPYRLGDTALAERYEALLSRSRGLTLVDLSRSVLRAAAQLRAVHGIATPDALQVAAALSTRCGSFLTNDRRIPELPGMRVLQLHDLA
jgi:predicted nucleic acid-binding protein